MYSITITAPAKKLILLVLSFILISSCSTEDEHTLFQLLPPDRTGITFSNTIETNNSVNVQTDSFIYNGAGVAIGDINNNGYPDLFFAGNMVSSRLYLNKGDMQFEDITETAGIITTRWATGVSMVDINNNGYLDIYVSVSGPEWTSPEDRANLLFLNNGDNTFTEAAADFNVADTGFTTHAVFFDYNLNGYLDLFLLGNSPGEFGRGESGRRGFGQRSTNPDGFDQLYRNNGDGTFTNVSEEAGILKQLGYGLGVVVTDLNGNGWPDIYVSNDITPNDVLYINNKDGTFTDRAADFLRHTSFAGMGIDIADFTNNGWPDIMQTDMMSEVLSHRKRMSGSTTYSGFTELRRSRFFPHYNINTLQMNHGIDEEGEIIFSEIARMAGVAYTDWSWTALFGDYDNDGFKDLLITNGYPKAVNDFDYLSNMNRARQLGNPDQIKQRELEILENLHDYKVSNYLFRNNGDLTFANKTNDWGLYDPGFSYGAAHADLNNNGRLDIVMNNINDPVFIYENVAPEEDNSHFLQIKLQGKYPNIRGIGAKLTLTAGDQKQFLYHSPYRGYMSTMDDRAHFGLGEFDQIDTLEVIWPDGRTQILTGISANQIITVNQADASENGESEGHKTEFENRPFQPITDNGLNYEQRENQPSVDYGMQPLLPYMISRQGPPIAVGDVTGNGLDDVYIGGGWDTAGVLFLQQDDGSFIEASHQQPFNADRNQEDWGAHFFDATGNGLLDLYVASGGYQTSPVSDMLQDRLYINHGNGRFLKDTQALPQMLTSTKAIASGDFTGNGQTDLFVGGRLIPGDYPKPARSYILQNNGGRFTDVTHDLAPELAEPSGMITDAVWIDYNGNGRNDLVTTGEWMPVQFFENDGERLINVTESTGLPPMRGWWYSIEIGDFNNNGFPDFVAGNLGLNYSYTTSEESKFGIYASDFSENRNTEIILTKEIDSQEYPFYGLALLGREMDLVAINFRTFESFMNAAVRDVFGSTKINNALHYQADTFANSYLENNGDGSFTLHQLPNHAQVSPIKGIISHDVDGDGNLDIIVAGNLYQTEPNTPRADAGNGLWLKGDGTGNFTPVSPLESGFLAPLDVRGLSLINTPNGKAILVANNSDSLQIFSIQKD
ncbi:VCBS repeat-containing protein [soil metagenome]